MTLASQYPAFHLPTLVITFLLRLLAVQLFLNPKRCFMKKQYMLFIVPVMLVTIFQSTSCLKPPPNFDPRNADNVYTGCRIKSINDVPVLYNRNNDPVSFIHDGQAYTGNPNIVFKYDNRNRLLEYAALFSNNSYGFVHRYTYNQQRIVADTEYVFGSYGVPDSYAFKNIYYPVYDNLGRVAQDSVVNYTSYGTIATRIQPYVYTADGNRYNSITYDNKLNPHRTNKIWMFIDRDYSINNPVPAVTYNGSGLPLTYDSKNVFNFHLMSFDYRGATTVTYECK
jgi:hypothetical protein